MAKLNTVSGTPLGKLVKSAAAAKPGNANRPKPGGAGQPKPAGGGGVKK